MQSQQHINNSGGGSHPPNRRSRLSGMTWLWIGLAGVFAIGIALSFFIRQDRNVRRANATEPRRSYFGVDQFQTTNNGVTFDAVEPAGGPADRAGLVGGDIITSFDGRPVTTLDGLMDLLNQTPVNKTVEVIYRRDGDSHKATLTTISADDFNRLRDAGDRPEGMLGFEIQRTTRINLPENKTYGVRLDYLRPNSPADLFGIKEGDIVTDFDKVPIRTPRELVSRVHRATPRSTVEVVLLRAGQTMKIPVVLGQSR